MDNDYFKHQLGILYAKKLYSRNPTYKENWLSTLSFFQKFPKCICISVLGPRSQSSANWEAYTTNLLSHAPGSGSLRWRAAACCGEASFPGLSLACSCLSSLSTHLWIQTHHFIFSFFYFLYWQSGSGPYTCETILYFKIKMSLY